MIAIEKLKGVKRLITHANCADGISSALIVRDALPDVEVTFMQQGTEEHQNLASLPGTLFCDFTPHIGRDPLGVDDAGLKDAIIKVWIDAGAIVLDHHPTQRELTMAFVEAGLGVFGENSRGECGAWLAYEHVWAPIVRDGALDGRKLRGQSDAAVREFAELAGVRDTWKKDDPRWQAACEQAEALMFWGFDRLCLASLWASEKFDIGKVLFEKKLEAARKSIAESYSFWTERGTRVLVFQGVTETSDAAEILEKDWDERERYGGAGHYQDGDRPTDIVAGFHYRVDAGRLVLQFSTRSHTGYDVGAFCKSLGGGGHHAAAGFTVEHSPDWGWNPYTVFKNLLEQWEARQKVLKEWEQSQ